MGHGGSCGRAAGAGRVAGYGRVAGNCGRVTGRVAERAASQDAPPAGGGRRLQVRARPATLRP